MPAFLENKLKSEYGAHSATPFKVMNSIGAMHGSKETPKGAEMQRMHDKKAMVRDMIGKRLMVGGKGTDPETEPGNVDLAGVQK